MREIHMEKWVHTGRGTDLGTAGTSMDHLRSAKICLSVCLQASHSQEPPENPALFKTHISGLPNLLLSSACFTRELQPEQGSLQKLRDDSSAQHLLQWDFRRVSPFSGSLRGFWPRPEVVWNRAGSEPAQLWERPGELPSLSVPALRFHATLCKTCLFYLPYNSRGVPVPHS